MFSRSLTGVVFSGVFSGAVAISDAGSCNNKGRKFPRNERSMTLTSTEASSIEMK